MKNKPKKDKSKGKDKDKTRNGAAPSNESHLHGEADPDPNDNEERTKLLALTEEEFNSKYLEMLDEMNIKSERARKPMLEKDHNTKVGLLWSFMKRQKQNISAGGLVSAEDYIKELQRTDLSYEHLLQSLQSLRVSITGRPISWIQNFGEQGLECLLNHLRSFVCSSSQLEQKIQHECAKCLKAFMNNRFGLNLMLKNTHGLTLLAQCIRPENAGMMHDVVKVMGAVCLVAHDKALEAVTMKAEAENKSRFLPIIDALKGDQPAALKVACLQLVNALVSTPDDLDFRLHLRNELIRTGLAESLPNLRELDLDELNMQLEIFDDQKDEDGLEFQHRYNEISIHMDDSQELFHLITTIIKDTTADGFFLSVLQHMLLIRDDVYARPQYYKLIDECVSQIVLQKNGIDPDFKARKMDIDFESAVEAQVEKTKTESFELKIKQLEERLKEETTRRSEIETKLEVTVQNHETKVKAIEDEVVSLKDQVAKGGGPGPAKAPGAPPPPPPPGGGPPPPPPPPLPGGGGPPPPPPPPFPGGGPPPPPPPPFPGGGPPPPPPPPGMGGGPPPPPPPPGMGGPPPPGGPPRPPGGMPGAFRSGPKLPAGMSQKKKYSTTVQTKRLNWTAIHPTKLKDNTFWVLAKENTLENADYLKQISDTFASKPSKKIGSGGDGDGKEERKKGNELKVLDAKAAQNLSIFLGSYKMTFVEMRNKIICVDDETMTDTALGSLLKFLPGTEQIQQLLNFKHQYDELQSAEQFAFQLGSVSRLEQRLQCMQIRRCFDEEVKDVKPNIVNVTEACKEVKNSTKFKKFLELVLLTGNYMNAGSRNERSYGYDLNLLIKLGNTKSSDGSLTLVHFLASTIEDNYPEISGFENDISHVEQAARASDDIMQKAVNMLRAGLTKIESELKHHQDPKNPDDKFPFVMKEFVNNSKPQVEILDSMHKKMSKLFQEVIDYFCLDPKKNNVEEFFGSLHTFLAEYEQAKKDNQKRKEQAEKDRKAKERAELDRKKKEAAKRGKKVFDVKGDANEEGVLDGLMQALETGSAFRDPSRTPRRRGPRNSNSRDRTPSNRGELHRTGTRTNIVPIKMLETGQKLKKDNKSVLQDLV